MQWVRSAFAFLFLLCALAIPLSAETRYDDILYLDELKQPVLRLKVLTRTPLNRSREPESNMAYLAEGQVVEISALGETQDYVAARIPTGPARGWVDAKALEPPPASLLAKLQLHAEKAQAHHEMIARHEVAAGMARVEVRASIGKAERVQRRHTKEGDEEQWFYTMYKYLPYYVQSTGDDAQTRRAVSYHRVATGQRVVTFRYDEVITVDEQRDEKANAPSIKTAPAIPVRN